MKDSTADYDAMAAQYARHRRVDPGVLGNLVLGGGLNGGSRVLEVGCGTGNYTIALAETVGCSCWGVEPSGGMVSSARQRSEAGRVARGKTEQLGYANVRFTRGRAEQLGFADGAFDLVFSVDVIHHVEEPVHYFDAAHRVLKEGGRICTVTDSEDMIRRRRPLSVYFPETVDADLGRYPGVARLREMMTRAGFTGLREQEVEMAYSVTDAQPYRDKAFSCLHLIPEDPFQRGLERMEHDLEKGPIEGVAEYCLVWAQNRR